MTVLNKATVISLTYNNWHLLGGAIKSLVAQDLAKDFAFEYIIADDGTSDFDISYISQLLEPLKSKDWEVNVIINQKNIGTVASLNSAIKKSTGDFILLLSADDEFYDNRVLCDVIDKFNESGADIITALRVPVIKSIEQTSLPDSVFRPLFKEPQKLLKYIALNGNIISGASTYYRRSLFDNVGFFDEQYRLLEDYPFYLYILSKGVHIELFERKVIKYGMDGISSDSNINPLLRADFQRAYQYSKNLSILTFSEKRYVHFNLICSKEEKLRATTILCYIDQVIMWVAINRKNTFKEIILMFYSKFS